MSTLVTTPATDVVADKGLPLKTPFLADAVTVGVALLMVKVTGELIAGA